MEFHPAQHTFRSQPLAQPVHEYLIGRTAASADMQPEGSGATPLSQEDVGLD
jgi:hypothetical protein